MSLSLVLHIPHSSTVVPELTCPPITLGKEALDQELMRMTDWFTEQLFQVEGAARVVFPISRLVVDPERFLDKAREAMSRAGMGVIYTRTSGGLSLRQEPTHEQRSELIERFYVPHHRTLAEAVNLALSRHGHALLLDCHSFPSVPLPYELDRSLERPQVCLGTDPFHTPSWLLNAAREAFESRHLSVAVNKPFSGALVPASHHGQDERVLALMIEVNRSLYMEESEVCPSEDFNGMRTLLQEAVLELLAVCRQHFKSDN